MDAERLEPIDAAFLSLDGPVTTGHMCLVAILDGPTTLARLRAQLEEGLDRVPILRRRLHSIGFGLDRPWWVDDEEFDITDHLFEEDLPDPGDRLALAEAAARIDQKHLDRARPLWELHLVHRLAAEEPVEHGRAAGDRSAIVIKIHHAAVDGVGARDLLAQLFPGPPGSDRARRAVGAPGRRRPQAWTPKPVPSAAELLLHSAVDAEGALGTAVRWENRASRGGVEVVERVTGLVTGAVERSIGLRVPDLLRHVGPWRLPSGVGEGGGEGSVAGDCEGGREGSREGIQDTASPARRWFNPAPACIINRAITNERTWAFGTVPLDRVSALRAETGCTVNDVVLAATAGGLRAWLLEQGALPRRPLVAMVPISMRPVGVAPTSGNQIALTLCDIPTHLGDPLTRLTVVRDDMAEAKAAPSMSQTLLEDVARVTAPAVTRLITGGFYALGLAERVRLPFNLIVSNVPAGPRSGSPGGRAVLGTYPLPPLSDAMGLNLTVQGRDGCLDIGLSACPELVPDVWHVLDLIREAYDELGDLVDQAAQRAMGAAERAADRT